MSEGQLAYYCVVRFVFGLCLQRVYIYIYMCVCRSLSLYPFSSQSLYLSISAFLYLCISLSLDLLYLSVSLGSISLSLFLSLSLALFLASLRFSVHLFVYVGVFFCLSIADAPCGRTGSFADAREKIEQLCLIEQWYSAETACPFYRCVGTRRLLASVRSERVSKRPFCFANLSARCLAAKPFACTCCSLVQTKQPWTSGALLTKPVPCGPAVPKPFLELTSDRLFRRGTRGMSLPCLA